MAQPRPIGMRIPRPYDSEEDFISGDGLAIGRLGMILIGASKRPPGITIRFELLLRDGKPVFRGEGRVVAHRVHANGREGLEIRFTRLDSRSKHVVEQVLELRRTGKLTPAAVTIPPAARDAMGAQDEQDPPAENEVGPVTGDVPAEASAYEPEPEPTRAEQAAAPSESPEPPQTTKPEPVKPDQATLASAIADQEAVRQADASVPPPVETRDADELPDDDLDKSLSGDAGDKSNEPLNDDLSPLALPVNSEGELAGDDEQASPVEEKAAMPVPPPQTEVSQDVSAALSRLRKLSGTFVVPEPVRELVDRLRDRAKVG